MNDAKVEQLFNWLIQFISLNIPPGIGFILFLGEGGREATVRIGGNIDDRDVIPALEHIVQQMREAGK